MSATDGNYLPPGAALGDPPISSNAKRLLWAGFMAILAAGIGFAIRGAIFATWSADFGFTGAQNGAIGGAGFTGFCFGIIIGGVIVDKIGYGKLIITAFVLHVLSAFITFGASKGMSQESAFLYLFCGTFCFALANGTLEAVANPLVATLFPKNRTHYLNILHASWPAGMVIGGLATSFLGGNLQWSWKMQLGLFLVPVAIYGLMFLGQKFPKSEASAKGFSLGEMMKDVGILGASVAGFLLFLFTRDSLGGVLGGITGNEFFTSTNWVYVAYAVGIGFVVWVAVITNFAIGHWLLFVLFVAHALVGSVELGTDGWIQNINGSILTPEQGTYLFIFASAIMFSLRFCAHWIETKLGLSPAGILLVCSIFAAGGLLLAAGVTNLTMAFLAMAVYAIGKTFFWPTMLAVASDRFPRTGAVAMSIMGGIGMMSAGQLGSPGLGYFKDRYTSEHMAEQNQAAILQANKSEKPSKWLNFDEVTALDGTKLEDAKKADPKTAEQKAMVEGEIAGSRKTLRVDALIPCTMAVIYLLILLYFKSIGGYKAVKIEEQKA
jgi:DHA2 family metal-tetracycline-proton antiporter-like MFS transporter